MKKLLLSFIVLLAILPASAQEPKNIIGISPLQLATNLNLRIKYERVYSEALSFGLIATYHSPFIFYAPGAHDPGLDHTPHYYMREPRWEVAVNPFVRYYFKKHAPTGGYFQGKFVIAYGQGDYHGTYEYRTHITVGLSLDIGYQWSLTERWTLDISIGYTIAQDEDGHPSYYMFYPPAIPFIMGMPYFPLSGLFNFGYRF